MALGVNIPEEVERAFSVLNSIHLKLYAISQSSEVGCQRNTFIARQDFAHLSQVTAEGRKLVRC